MTTTTHPKWYQEPIVWLIWGLLISVVLACAVTVVLAIKSDDGLVVDDYYREGLAINRTLNANEAAINMGLRARIDAEPQLITVTLNSAQGLANEAQFSLRWVHPTNQHLDANTLLLISNASQVEGEYRWQLNPQAIGLHGQWQSHRWHLLLFSEATASPWRIQGVMPVCCSRATILQAQ